MPGARQYTPDKPKVGNGGVTRQPSQHGAEEDIQSEKIGRLENTGSNDSRIVLQPLVGTAAQRIARATKSGGNAEGSPGTGAESYISW